MILVLVLYKLGPSTIPEITNWARSSGNIRRMTATCRSDRSKCTTINCTPIHPLLRALRERAIGVHPTFANMPSYPRFRINSKNYFLTYPHCSLSKEEALSQLQNIQTNTNKLFIRVARELHENGEPHLHVLIQFEGRYQCTNSRQFDLVSPTRSAHFHPNIQAARSSSDVKTYVEKDGDFCDFGVFQIDGRSSRGAQQTANDAYAEALNSGSKLQALGILREKAPKDFVLQFHNLNANLDRIFEVPPAIYSSPFLCSSFNQVPEALEG